MSDLIGKVTASLIEKGDAVPEGLIEKINENIKPPEAISPDDIYIRAMYIISDQVNTYGGRFPDDEHDRLIELLIDCPVLIGHRKDTLPIARNFYAEKVRRDGSNWVKVYFYWLKNSEKGEDLRKNIDGGIYKECSISFVFRFPECTICGSDIRECRHRPFVEYDVSGGKRTAYFNYRQVEKVLETSLVYRGSMPETSITKELFAPPKKECDSFEDGFGFVRPGRHRIWDVARLDTGKSYLVMPAYESLVVFLERAGDRIRLMKPSGARFDSPALSSYIDRSGFPPGNYALECRLIGHRGKERQSVSELLKYFNGEKGKVRRLDLKVYDLWRLDDEVLTDMGAGVRRAKLERLFSDDESFLATVGRVDGAYLPEAIERYSTRYGSEIYDMDSSERFLLPHRKLIPLRISEKGEAQNGPGNCLQCLCNGKIVAVEAELASGYGTPEEVIEVEIGSIRVTRDSVKVAHARVVDRLGPGQELDDILRTREERDKPTDLSKYAVFDSNNGGVILQLHHANTVRAYFVNKFSRSLLEKNRRFPARPVKEFDPEPASSLGAGHVLDYSTSGQSIIVRLDGYLTGKFMLRPMVLNGKKGFLFYRVDHAAHQEDI
jgi:hypothetical protein